MNTQIVIKKYLILVVLVFVFAIAGYYWFNHTSPQKYTGPVEKITIGTIADYSTLVMLAQERGYFKDNGLDVKTIEHSSGAPAFADLLAGKADVVLAADFVGVLNSFKTEDFKIIATITKVTDGFEVVARKDHGIATPADLKGKKIGVTKKTSGEFWLGTFLIFNNLLPQSITIVDFPPDGLEAAIVKGDIDAVLTFEPHIFDIKKSLGERAIHWSGQNGRNMYPSLFATTDIVKNHPQTIERLIRALVQAEEFVTNNHDEAMKLIAERFHHDDAYMQSVIPKFKFTVSLDQAMLISMEDQAQWIIANKLTDKSVIPHYLDYMYTDALRKINRDAVTIY